MSTEQKNNPNALAEIAPTVLKRRVFDAASHAAENDRHDPRTRNARNGRDAAAQNKSSKRKRGGKRHPTTHLPPPQNNNPHTAISHREQLASTWWGKQWIETIEKLGSTYANRIARAVPLFEANLISELKFSPGKVECFVGGRKSNPDKVSVSVRQLTPPQWKKVVEMLGHRASFTASLLAGELPETISQVFEQCGLSLFPKRVREFKSSCTCPHHSKPCDHIAATFIAISKALDNDPFSLLLLRGQKREDILAALRAARSGEDLDDEPSGPGNEHLGLSSSTLDPNTFFKAHDDLSDFRFHIALPDISLPILRKLGSPPEWHSPQRLEHYLTAIYQLAAQQAESIGLREIEPPPQLPIEDLETRFPNNSSLNTDEDPLETEPGPRTLSMPPGTTAAIADSAATEEGDDDNIGGARVLIRRGRRAEPDANKGRRQRTPGREQRRPLPTSPDASAPPTPLPEHTPMPLDNTVTDAIPDAQHIAHQIIWAIKTHGAATARQLARRTRKKKNAIGILLQSLLDAGLLTQEGVGDRARFDIPSGLRSPL